MIVELGYPALRLFGAVRRRIGVRVAAILVSIFIAIAAGLTVGFYEYFAYRAGWWKYAPAHAMIGSFCALFIPVGEALMFLAIPPIAARMLSRDDRPIVSAVAGGAAFSVAIFAGYALAYLLLEYGRAP